MALRGDYLRIYVEQFSSATAPTILADTTDVNIDFSAESVETTTQDSALAYSGIAGKHSGTISGSMLVSPSGTTFATLYSHMTAGDTIDVEVYDYVGGAATKYFSASGHFTSLTAAAGDSTTVVTGSYAIQLTGAITFA